MTENLKYDPTTMIWLLSTINTLSITGLLFWYSYYGLDFTDESFYLIWMANPFAYNFSHSQFGFLYHPLYQLVQGDIVLLRKANILLLFLLSFFLTNILIKSIYKSELLQTKYRWIISGGIASTSFAFFQFWLPTPSYNSLAMQALLISASGFVLLDKEWKVTSILGWFLLGIGGWASFMAKPTTAATLGICSIMYLFMADKYSIRCLAISVLTALGLFILTGLYIDGSMIKFIERIKMGVEMSQVLGGHDLINLFRLDKFELNQNAKWLFGIIIMIVFCSVYFLKSNIKFIYYIGIAISLTILIVNLIISLGIVHKNINLGGFQGLLLFSIPAAAFFTGLVFCKANYFSATSRYHWALIVCFFIFPYVFAFGTGNNYWFQGGLVAIFWVLGSLILIFPVIQKYNKPILLLPFVLLAQLITLIMLNNSFEYPYRQPQPLRLNDSEVKLSFSSTPLKMSEQDVQYINKLNEIASNNHFSYDTPIIDLTGYSPGIIFLLGANNIGAPWILGGYSGSDDYAVAVLNNVSCEILAKAWLLLEPEGKIKISLHILKSFGANLSLDFERVDTIIAEKGTGGLALGRYQILLKPVRSIDRAKFVCLATRGKNNIK